VSYYKSVSACQNYCAQDDACVAVEFDSTYTECWVHENIDNLNKAYDPVDITINQYLISRRCGSDSISIPTRTTGLLPSEH